MDLNLVPSFDCVVECERRLYQHFEWDLNFVLPIHFVRMLLAQGVIFTNELRPYEMHLSEEDYLLLRQELSRAISAEALSLCDILTTKGSCFLRGREPNEISASIIYFARKNILQSEEIHKLVKVPSIWPDELIILTRCTEANIHKIIQNPDIKNKIVVPNSTPVSEQFATEPNTSTKDATKTKGNFKSPKDRKFDKQLSEIESDENLRIEAQNSQPAN